MHMYDHIGIHVTDLTVSLRFYGAALAPLGHELCSQDEASAGLGPSDQPMLWLYAANGERSRGAHLAFRAKDRAAVAAFYQAGLSCGGRDNGPPGLRESYGPSYYAAFLLDPDGNNVEAVCLENA